MDVDTERAHELLGRALLDQEPRRASQAHGPAHSTPRQAQLQHSRELPLKASIEGPTNISIGNLKVEGVGYSGCCR